jgi:CMP-N-acetylneuraminic acid synthetase
VSPRLNLPKPTVAAPRRPKVSIWGLVLSRQGSQRLPNKVLTALADRPLIDYTFAAMKASQRLTHRWVYSNDPGVLLRAEQAGIQQPHFPRPDGVSQPDTSSTHTIRSFLGGFFRNAWPDLLVLLQPTSPLRLAADIDAAIARFEADPEADVLWSVTQPSKPLQWALWQQADGQLAPAFDASPPEAAAPPSRPRLVYPNGAIYIARPSHWWKAGPQTGRIIAYEMPWRRSVDIDDAADCALAEYWLAHAEVHKT